MEDISVKVKYRYNSETITAFSKWFLKLVYLQLVNREKL
jgi:hypothetical protein